MASAVRRPKIRCQGYDVDVIPLRTDLPYWGYEIDLSLAGSIKASLNAIVEELKSKPVGPKPARVE